MVTTGDEQFRWEALVPCVIHPLKVAIIEAMNWVGQPLSATDLTKVIAEPEWGLAHVSYHVQKLVDAGALVKVGQRKVRGSLEKFYRLREFS